jgi:flagellar motility protein MotE (MotC chaperone)
MKARNESMLTNPPARTDAMISRRLALGSSGLAVLGLLSGSALGQTEQNEADTKKRPVAQPPKEFQERMEKSKAFSERLRNADSMEERQQIMNEQMAWQRQRAFEDLKDQLHIPDQEWPVVKPRLQAVYDRVHPASQMGRNEQPKTELEQKSRELRELLRDDATGADQIKAKLTAFRAAKDKANQQLAGARQSLRQLMSLRLERPAGLSPA